MIITGRDVYESWAGRTLPWEDLSIQVQSAWLEASRRLDSEARKGPEETIPVARIETRLSDVERRIDEMRADTKGDLERIWDIMESVRTDLKKPSPSLDESNRRSEALYSTFHSENLSLRTEIASLRMEVSSMRDDVTKRLGHLEGRSGGLKDALGWIFALIALVVSVFAIVLKR